MNLNIIGSRLYKVSDDELVRNEKVENELKEHIENASKFLVETGYNGVLTLFERPIFIYDTHIALNGNQLVAVGNTANVILEVDGENVTAKVVLEGGNQKKGKLLYEIHKFSKLLKEKGQ